MKTGRGKLIRADFDHASEISDSTVASGWLKDMYIDDDKGLMGTLVVSESGASALKWKNLVEEPHLESLNISIRGWQT